jgi:hypothetical protein
MGRNQNGLLLKKAEETGFELLITMDSNMTFQPNLAGHRLKIVVLRARSNRLADTIPLTPKILQTSLTLNPCRNIRQFSPK